MAKPTNKRYEITTISQMLNVTTEENFERIGPDFLLWLHFCVKTAEKTKKQFPKEMGDKKTSDVFPGPFVWIDDGKNIIKEVKTTNTDTGEVKTIKRKRK